MHLTSSLIGSIVLLPTSYDDKAKNSDAKESRIRADSDVDQFRDLQADVFSES